MAQQLLQTAPEAVDTRQLDDVCRALLRTRCSFSHTLREHLEEYVLAVIVEDQVAEPVRDRARDILLILHNGSFPPNFPDAAVPHDVAAAVGVLNSLGPCFAPVQGSQPGQHPPKREQLQQALHAVLLLQEQERGAVHGSNRWAQFESWLTQQVVQHLPQGSAQGSAQGSPSRKSQQHAVFQTEQQLLCTLRCAFELRYPVAAGQAPQQQLLEATLQLCLELLGRQVSDIESAPAKHSSRAAPATQTDVQTAISALRLMNLLLLWQADYAQQVLASASTVLRGTLPLGGGLLVLQSTALHTVLQALDNLENVTVASHRHLGPQGPSSVGPLEPTHPGTTAATASRPTHGAQLVRRGHAELLEDLQDLFKLSVSCRWVDHVGMLHLLDVLEGHRSSLLRHHPTLLPRYSPLLYKAAAWAPHLLGRHLLALLPMLVSPSTLPSLLPYTLDLPCLVLGSEAVVSRDVRTSDLYNSVRWTPHTTTAKKPARSAFGGLSPLTSYFGGSSTPAPALTSSPISPYRQTGNDGWADGRPSSLPLAPAPDVLSNLMDRDFTGGATAESEYHAEQSGALQLFLEDLGRRDTFERPLGEPWRTPVVQAGFARLMEQLQLHDGTTGSQKGAAGSQKGPSPRLRYVLGRLGPCALAIVLKLTVQYAADEILQVLVQHLVSRRCRVLPWPTFQEAAGRLQRGFLAAAVQRQPQLLWLLRSKLLKLAAPDTDPLLMTDTACQQPLQAGVAALSSNDAVLLAKAYACEDLRLAAAVVQLLGEQRTQDAAAGHSAFTEVEQGSVAALLLANTPAMPRSLLQQVTCGTGEAIEPMDQRLFQQLYEQAYQRLQVLARAWHDSAHVSTTVRQGAVAGSTAAAVPLARTLSRPETPSDGQRPPLFASPSRGARPSPAPALSPTKKQRGGTKGVPPRPRTPPQGSPTPGIDIPSPARQGMGQPGIGPSQIDEGTAGSPASTTSRVSTSFTRTSASFSILGALRSPLETLTDALSSSNADRSFDAKRKSPLLDTPVEHLLLSASLLCSVLTALVRMAQRKAAITVPVRQLVQDSLAAAGSALPATTEMAMSQVQAQHALQPVAAAADVLHARSAMLLQHWGKI